MIQVNRIYLIFNRLVTKKFLVDTSVKSNLSPEYIFEYIIKKDGSSTFYFEFIAVDNNNQSWYLQPIITQYFIDNKSEIWLLFLIAHSKR